MKKKSLMERCLSWYSVSALSHCKTNSFTHINQREGSGWEERKEWNKSYVRLKLLHAFTTQIYKFRSCQGRSLWQMRQRKMTSQSTAC